LTQAVSPTPPFRSNRDREDERRQKREALLEAAVRMFNARGFHATSLDDVAASVGVTKPVIYHHLGNKDQVLFECIRMGLQELRVVAKQAGAEPGSGLDRLKSYLRRYGEVVMGEFGKCVIRTGDEVLCPDTSRKVRALKAQVDSALRSLIEAAIADRSARAVDVRLAAFSFAGALNWTARWFQRDGQLATGEVARGIVDMLCGGIESDIEQAGRRLR
jgi:AcrR family transcriptional regulator